MTFEKFTTEVETLKKFFQIYCEEKHENRFLKNYSIEYHGNSLEFSANLCDECHSLLNYSIQRLQECPHDPKPRCRKCENPCYEKDKYKQMAKMMRFAGMKLGLTKAAKRLKRMFKRN